MKVEITKRYYSIDEVSKLLGVNKQSFYQKIHRGLVEAVKLGKNYYLHEDQLKPKSHKKIRGKKD